MRSQHGMLLQRGVLGFCLVGLLGCGGGGGPVATPDAPETTPDAPAARPDAPTPPDAPPVIPDAAGIDASPLCGNSVVDPGESCDTAILNGAGACPADCGDGDACSTDVFLRSGLFCSVSISPAR